MGVWAVCGIGAVFSMAAIVVGFFPPAGLSEASAVSHTVALIVAVAASVLAPLVISKLSQRRRQAL